MKRCLILCVTAIGLSVEAQGICSDAKFPHHGDQSECLDREFKRLDKEVTARYQELIKTLSDPDIARILDNASEVKALLAGAQASWRNYREKQCAAVTAAIHGTGYGVWRGTCNYNLTKARLEELRAFELSP